MSYLNLPRLTFAGFFEADVNTVNNDVRNYDTNVFEARMQTPMVTDKAGTVYNGWWNPDGTNAFRLLECRITGAAAATGDVRVGGPVFNVEAQRTGTQAKIVDLDPQFQFASGIWGMRLTIMAGDAPLLSATLRPTCFRDIYFGRLIDQATGQPVPASPGASARFTGTLTEVKWWDETAGTPAAAHWAALRAAGETELTLSLLTFGYSKSRGTNGFTVGSVIGSIGPRLPGDPETFARGRRFAPSATSQNPFAAASGIGYMTAAVSPDGSVLSVDFGAALPMLLGDNNRIPDQQAAITLQDIGPITVAVLRATDQVVATAQGLTATPCAGDGQGLMPDQYETIGVLTGYASDWLWRTGGIADFPIPAAARALLTDHPLAVLTETGGPAKVIAIRETIAGGWVRADQFVQRVDTAPEGWVSAPVSLYAMKWGKPWTDASLSIALQPPTPGQGGTGDDNEQKPPQTFIPVINTPPDKIEVPATISAAPNGVAVLDIQVADPGNPRKYLDGQIYQINYSLALIGQSPMPMFECVAVHARDSYVPPASPGWADDVAPILLQYGNLYPIMSKGLFSFSDPLSVEANARLFHLAFTRPIEDPNYMPATRDMSAGKLNTIVKWLIGYLPEPSLTQGTPPPLPVGQLRAQARLTRHDGGGTARVSAGAAQTALHILGGGADGKTAAVRAFLKNVPHADSPDNAEGEGASC